jgi:hypothetical protein
MGHSFGGQGASSISVRTLEVGMSIYIFSYSVVVLVRGQDLSMAVCGSSEVVSASSVLVTWQAAVGCGKCGDGLSNRRRLGVANFLFRNRFRFLLSICVTAFRLHRHASTGFPRICPATARGREFQDSIASSAANWAASSWLSCRTAASLWIRLASFWQAWSTVVWSRPPNWRPISA